jgi:uncharacterized membrane protein
MLLFRIGVVIKTLQGLLEVIGGFILIFVSADVIVRTIESITRQELIEDPTDFFSKFISQVTTSLSVSNNTFAVFYLLSHGVIKLFLVIGLLKKQLWSYYAFIVCLIVFIIYQIYRYFHSFSISLLIFTLFDILFVWLTWHEAKMLKKHLKKHFA